MILLSCSLESCKKDKTTQEIKKTVTEWTGKTIRFPEDYQCHKLGNDTFPELCANLFQAEYKILLYTDSLGCTTCKLKLYEWKRLIYEANSIATDKQLSFLFFFHPKSQKELQLLMKKDDFNYPVFIDLRNKIQVINRFPDKQSYQCFLLDQNNKVLMIGNPVISPQIWKLYKELIFGKTTGDKDITTTIETEKTLIDLGDISVGNSKQAVFTLKNTGNHPLVISHVSTSCGCTSVEWDKQPVKPGMITKIKLKMKPDHSGYFNKTADVFCNAKNTPVKLTITGTAN